MSNFPLPDVLQDPGESPEYMCVPEYKGTFEIKPRVLIIDTDDRFSGIDGFGFTGPSMQQNSGWTGFTGPSSPEISWQERHRQEEETARANFFDLASQEPTLSNEFINVSSSDTFEYAVRIENANTTEMEVVLFDSYTTRTASNFGNRSGITIYSDIPNVSYGALLARTESARFIFNRIFINVLSGFARGAIANPMVLERQDAAGRRELIPLRFLQRPTQNDPNSCELEIPGQALNGYTKLTLRVPASTSIQLIFFPQIIEGNSSDGNGPDELPAGVDYQSAAVEAMEKVFTKMMRRSRILQRKGGGRR